MLRSSRLAVLTLALSIVAAPTAQAADTPDVRQAAPTAPKVDSVSTKQIVPFATLALTVTAFETMRPNFHPGDTAEAVVDSASTGQRWSERTQRAIQTSTFDNALRSVYLSGTFEPGSFSRNFIDSVVAFAGADNARESAKSFKPKKDQYRRLLRAISESDVAQRFPDSAFG